MSLELRRKYSFRVGDQKIILVKKAYESDFHVMAKVLVYALYREQYPSLTVERVIGDRYKPDLVAEDDAGHILLWAECGAVKPEKITKILRKFRKAQFVFVKKASHVRPFLLTLNKIVAALKYPVRVEVIAYPENLERYIDDKGDVHVTRDAVAIHMA